MRLLGIKMTGGSHSHLSRQIKKYGIPTEHFTGQGWNAGRPAFTRRPWDTILVLRTDGRRQHTPVLRRALVEMGRPYQCVRCGNTGEWLGAPMTIQIEHKNRDWQDDRPENLEFLCPNCHSQPDGWYGRKSERGTPTVSTHTAPTTRVCPECGGSKSSCSSVCKRCDSTRRAQQTHIQWPPLAELKIRLAKSNYTKVSIELGVSDNAI